MPIAKRSPRYVPVIATYNVKSTRERTTSFHETRRVFDTSHRRFSVQEIPR